MLAAGHLQFARGTDAVEVAVKPDFEQQTWGVRRTAIVAGGHDEPQVSQLELINKLAQEPGGVVFGHPVFERWRKEKLLSVVRCDRLRHVDITLSTTLYSIN